jgi:hypothetical protein
LRRTPAAKGGKLNRAGARRPFRGDPEGREFIAFWLREERVLAGMNVNVGGVTDAIQALVRSGAAIDRKRLADPDQPLEELVPTEDSGRPKRLRVAKQMLSAPARFVGDRLAMRKAGGLESLKAGDGGIVDVDGEKVAAYRDDSENTRANDCTT